MSADRPDGSDEAELLRALFLEEALSHLAEIVEAQQALAAATEEGERLLAVDAMLRHLHTLKGAAGSVGFESIGRSAHDIEELCAEDPRRQPGAHRGDPGSHRRGPGRPAGAAGRCP